LVNSAVQQLPEERKDAGGKVSEEASDYFTALRKRQAELARQEAAVDYHRLRGGDQQ
jgi:phosphoribosyl-ATP pyrophosphohydrolase